MAPRVEKRYAYEEMEKLFKDAGLKLTGPRVAVFCDLTRNGGHPSAEDVYARVREGQPSITLNTVYRVLATFAASGLIRCFDNLTDRALYDDNLDEHHHFVCTGCGKIEDIYIANARELDLSGMAHEVREIDIRIRGLCRKCREK